MKDDTKCVYSMTYYYAELNCARMLYELQEAFAGADRLTMVEKQRLGKKIEALEKRKSYAAGYITETGCYGCCGKAFFFCQVVLERKTDNNQYDDPLF